MDRIELTQQEKDLLDVIMNDKFAQGAFCGMIFNAVEKYGISNSIELIDEQIKLALDVRLRAMELSK